jgi:threonine/homoserine/homoserine lactone efflux protein
LGNIPNLPVFFVATLILLLTPGPAVLYIVARSIDQGRLAGVVSVLSIEIGNFVHVLAVTLGLSAILVSSATVYSIVKLLGAGYLIYLGIRRILAHDSMFQVKKAENQNLKSIFRQGVAVAILNPKTAMFFFAFLPQFVDASKGSIPLQLFTLGCIFVFMAIITDGLYSLLAGTIGKWLKESPIFIRTERYFIGSVYLGLGVTAALAGIRNK